MYTVAIVDDNPVQAEELGRMLGATPVGKELAWEYFDTATALEERVGAGYKPDLLFMDICLHDPIAEPADTAAMVSEPAEWEAQTAGAPSAEPRTGIDVVEGLLAAGMGAQVVYISGYDTYHTRIYRTPHACYLQKPFTQADVDEAVEQALGRMRQASEQQLLLRLKGAERVVSARDIIYVESARRRVRVHTRTEVFETYARLADVQRALPQRFVRCHQSFLVNLDYVAALGTADVELLGGEHVPVSRRYRAAVREALFAHIRSGR